MFCWRCSGQSGRFCIRLLKPFQIQQWAIIRNFSLTQQSTPLLKLSPRKVVSCVLRGNCGIFLTFLKYSYYNDPMSHFCGYVRMQFKKLRQKIHSDFFFAFSYMTDSLHCMHVRFVIIITRLSSSSSPLLPASSLWLWPSSQSVDNASISIREDGENTTLYSCLCVFISTLEYDFYIRALTCYMGHVVTQVTQTKKHSHI